MIFEHKALPLQSKPNIKFNYISPNRPVSLLGYTYIPSFPTRTTSISKEQVRMAITGKVLKNPSKKKIFDRSYTCKNTLSSGFSVLESNNVTRTKSNLYKQNRRKPIFSNKETSRSANYTKNHQSSFKTSNHTSSFKQKPFSTINSNNPFRKQINSLHQSYQAVLEQKIQPLYQSKGMKSEIKVQLSDSATNRSIFNSQDYQGETDSRFFDKQNGSTPYKHQKLAEVNLYSTNVGSNFSKQSHSTRQPHLDSLYKQLKENLIPGVLIILGLLILMLQAFK